MSRGLVAWLAAGIVVAVVGVFAGRALKGPGAEAFDFDTDAPAYVSADLPQGRSRAGFTGFGESGGLDGAVIVAGRVETVEAATVTLDTTSGAAKVRVTGEQKLRLLQPFEGAISPGTTVAVIKKPGTDEAEALLVLLAP
jgi:hypothetical protein